jgi:hypothetical protein
MNMTRCDKCLSGRIMLVTAKCSDLCAIGYDDIDYDGYVPGGFPFSDEFGDYVEFALCLDCGKMQGKFPVSERAIIAFKKLAAKEAE